MQQQVIKIWWNLSSLQLVPPQPCSLLLHSWSPQLYPPRTLAAAPGNADKGLRSRFGSRIWPKLRHGQDLLCGPCSLSNDYGTLRSSGACFLAWEPAECQYLYHFFDFEERLSHSPLVISSQGRFVLHWLRWQHKGRRIVAAIVIESGSDWCDEASLAES